jgi:protein ImuA
MHDAGAASGFTLGMASLVAKQAEEPAPLLWIAGDGMSAEAGGLYSPGIFDRYGIAPDRLILSSARRIEDALWIAEEAASLAALSVVVLEVGPAPRKLDLTATRRLHRRAQIAGRPLFLLRHSGQPEPTAAPVRLQVAAAPAGERPLPGGTLTGSIGPPAVTVTISRSPNHMPASATLEWSDDAHIWRHRRIADAGRPPDSGPLAAPSADGPHIAPALGTVVAHGCHRRSAA